MKKILIALSFLLFGTYANADCNIKSGSINILANDFPALRTFVETSKQCKGSADFKVTHSSEHNKIAVPALTANPSEFSARIAANSSIVPLMNQDLIRPLDDLVKKYDECKIIFIPNVHDASPRVLCEGLCHNMRCLVNEKLVGGWKYVNDKTGSFFNTESFDNLSQKIIRVQELIQYVF